MTTRTRDWTETGLADAPALGERVLCVDDGHVAHATVLADNEDAEKALADYAATYDRGDYEGEIGVRWHLFEAGEETDRGEWGF